MTDIAKLTAKYGLPVVVAVFLGWLLLLSYQSDLKAAVDTARAAEQRVQKISDTVNIDLRKMTAQTARVEAMMELLLTSNGIPPPPQADFEPAEDSTARDST